MDASWATASLASASTMPARQTTSNGAKRHGSHRSSTPRRSPHSGADTTPRPVVSGSPLPNTSGVIEGSVDEPGDRLRIEQKVNQWYATLDATPSAMGRRKLPLRLVGDGTDGRFHDTSAGLTTIHSRESLADLAKAAGLAEISELRFRSNIAIEGCKAWDEFTWIGRRILIGDVEFRFRKTVTRCLATHVEPTSAERDIDVMGITNPHHRTRPTTIRRINRRQKRGNYPPRR